MYAIPMCVMCGDREVQIVVNSTGAWYCSAECEVSYHEDESMNESSGWYYVVINGHTNGYQNHLENIKNALYELFGDVPIATDDEVMSSVGVDWSIEIREVPVNE